MATKQTLKNSKSNSQDRTDLVAYWSIPLIDGVHTIEFEHGTTTGKRVLRVDGNEILRRDWMFKLVGEEKFTIGQQQAKCELRVDPAPHFSFYYSLFVNGKPLEKFTEKQAQSIKSWSFVEDGKRYRIIFGKQNLNIWVNGENIEAEHVFVEDGTEMRFDLGKSNVIIKANSIDKKEGVVHELYLNGKLLEEDTFD